MKVNKIFSLLLVVVAGIVMVSCKAKSDPTFETPACEAAVGKYVGTWILSEKDNAANTREEQGFFTITATEDRNVATVYVEFQNNGKTEKHEDVCNIAHRGESGIVFYNNSPKKFGTKFSGEIYGDKSSDMQFTMEVVNGRKKITYYFHFKGNASDFVPAN